MNVKEENICRLCLKVVDDDFQLIDEITRKMIEVLALRVNLDVSQDPIICQDCTENLIKCFNFKSACIVKEELKESFANDRNKVIFELKDEKDVDDIFVCRFCSDDLSRSNFVLLETLKNDVKFAGTLQALMPERDFDVIRRPGICMSCRQKLEPYIEFVENCLDVEEKITKYCRNEGTPSCAQVKLGDVLRFSFKYITELDYAHLHAIEKEEALPEDYSELIKTEEAVDIKDEDDNFSETETASDVPLDKLNTPSGIKSETKKKNLKLSTKKIPKAQVFKCTLCPHETNCKSNLKKHAIIHKDITELEMYKCSTCDFQTKRKGNLTCHTLTHKDITEVEMYKCSTCNYETKRKRNLVRHTLIHKDFTQLETYKCSTCAFQTIHKRSLQTHMLIHKDISEVNMFKCSKCSFQTKRKMPLTRHMLTHKDVTEVETYECSMCTFSTRHKRSLKYHTQIHRDCTKTERYRCSKCSYKTKFKNSLKGHTLSHKDIKMETGDGKKMLRSRVNRKSQ